MKHLFLGSNTPNGFVGFYDTVLTKGNRLFILKGGSGVGKHTFMKKCATIYEEKGYEIEYLHCSNDVDSLDGIIIVELQIAMIDGTNPHRVDPKLPGCFDEIIDLGVFINGNKMEQYKEEVFLLTQEKQKLYASAYHMLHCAYILYQDNNELLQNCMDYNQVNSLVKELVSSFITTEYQSIGETRNIFASSYTSKGYYDYIQTLLDGKKIIGIESSCIFTKILLKKIYEEGITSGYDITVCHSPMDIEKIDHVIFDEFAILSIDEYNKYNNVDELHKIDKIFDQRKWEKIEERIQWNQDKIQILVDKGIEHMKKCSYYHNQLEALYIPEMDFEGVDSLFKKIILKINNYL